MTVGRVTVTTTTPGAASDAGYQVRMRSAIERIAGDGDDRRDHSVLVVRRLRVDGVGTPAADAFRAKLLALRRGAAQPARGPVPADAEAVLFADQAELLACLTASIVAGRAGHRWYWRQVAPARPSDTGAAVAMAWGPELRWLPATLAQLPPRHAVAAVAALPDAVAARLLRALRAAHGMASPTPVPASNLRGVSDGGLVDVGASTAAGVVAARVARRAPSGRDDRPKAPWDDYLREFPDLPATTGPAAEALLGVAVALHRAPALSVRPEFAAAVDAWLACPPAPVGPGPGPGPGPVATAAPPRGSPGPSERAPQVATPSGAGADVVAGASERDGDDAASAGLVWAAAAANPPGPLFPTLPSGLEIATAYAGVLYLVNLVVWLDGPTIGPGGWAAVELLGRHLLAGRPGLDDDPLWARLAELDGRPAGTAPLVDIPAAASLRLPPVWLQRWAPGPRRWQWAPAGRSVVVRDRQGRWVVADVAAARGPRLAVAQAEVARLRRHRVDGALVARPYRCRVSPAGARSGARRWADSVGAFARWLLATRGIGPDVLIVPGRLSSTRTHVDLTCRLADANLVARRSGIDQDPGWVPALGRVVSFHFD